MAGKEQMTRRKQSRMAQNVRRKIQRSMAKILTEQTGSKVGWKESVEFYKQSGIEDSGLEALYKTYQSQVARKTKPGERNIKQVYSQSPESVSRALESFRSIRFDENDSGDLLRRNEMFKRDISQSTKKNGLSTLSGALTHGFYAATQYMWESATSTDMRNTYIMNEFGLKSLEQVYNLVTKSELKKEDFGFNDEELFQQWLDEIRSRVDLDELREIFHKHLGDIAKAHQHGGNTNDIFYNGSDIESFFKDYPEKAIAYIRKITATRLKSRYSK